MLKIIIQTSVDGHCTWLKNSFSDNQETKIYRIDYRNIINNKRLSMYKISEFIYSYVQFTQSI